MSNKHLEEQKLLIENFNSWINEGKCGEEEIDETAGHYMEAEPIEEEEEEDLNEIVLTSGALYALGRFLTSLHKLLGAYNEFTKVTDEMMQDPKTPAAVKQIAADVKQAGSDIAPASGEVAQDLPIGQKLTNKALKYLVKKHFNIDMDIDVSKLKIPSVSAPKEPEEEPPEEDPNPEPDDSEARSMQGLMSKEKESRLKQLRKKYNK